MKIKSAVLSSLLVIFCLASVPVQAQRAGHGDQQPRRGHTGNHGGHGSLGGGHGGLGGGHGGGLGGNGGISAAQFFSCNDGTGGWANNVSCGQVVGFLVVNTQGDAAGIILTQLPSFTFSSSNSGASFRFDSLKNLCASDFAVVFQGTKNGSAATIVQCSCGDAITSDGGCTDSTRYVFNAVHSPELNGLRVSSITVVLYGNADGDEASAYNFFLNGHSLSPRHFTTSCPTLPGNTCSN